MAAPAGAPVEAAAGRRRFDYDVIVVGAGIMGSCAAHAAASRGARTLLLERFDLLHGLGSSHGESRTIRDAYADARYPPMVRLARRLWERAEAESGRRVLTSAPLLSLAHAATPRFSSPPGTPARRRWAAPTWPRCGAARSGSPTGRSPP